ncbi:MAG: hypothetical protein ACREU4_03870 [Burkholderiales bacterium]
MKLAKLASLVSGETSFFLGNVAASIGHINGGRIRALGVTSKAEAPQLPGVPPIARSRRKARSGRAWCGKERSR